MRCVAAQSDPTLALDAGSRPQTAVRPWTMFLWGMLPLLVLYSATRARTVTGEDCGELVSAAYTLGIAHPPGSPIWVMLTKGFQTIFAGINPADAAALGSSITTAVALGLLAVLAFRVTRSRVAALFAAWTTGVGHEIWNHGTIAEVYPLNLLVLAGVLILFERWREAPSTRRFFWLTLLYGVGLANHPTFHLFLPIFGLAAIWVRPRILWDWRTLAVGFGGLLIPHLSYLQVWWAASQDPFVSWGVQPTFRSILAHYLRETYASGVPKTPLTGAKLAAQAAVFARYHLLELSGVGWVAALVGLGLHIRRDRILGTLVTALAVVGSFGLLFVVPFDLEREDLFAARVFLMPAYLVLGVGLAVAAAFIVDALRRRRAARFSWTVLLLPALAAGLGYPSHDRSHYFWVNDYAHALLDGLPRNAVMFPGGDTSTFPLIYLQCCEHSRPDVLVADRSGTVERARVLALLPADLRPRLQDASRDVLTDALIHQAAHPVVTLRPESPRRGDIVYEPYGLGFLAVIGTDKAATQQHSAFQDEFFKNLSLRNDQLASVQDYTSDLIQSHIAQARAGYLFQTGHPPDAIAEAQKAAAYVCGIKEALNNIASLLAEHGHEDIAEKYLRDALAIRPDYGIGRRNLVVILRNLRREADALEAAREGLALDPRDRVLFEQGAAAAMELGDGPDLKALCAVRVEADPKDALPHRLLGVFAREHEHSDLAARAHFERALELDPDDTESADAVRELDGRLSIPDALSMGPDKRDSLAALSTVPKPRLGRPLTPDHSGDGRRARRSGDDSIAPVPGAENLDQILDQARGMTGSDLQLPTPNASTASPRLGDDLTNSIGRHEGARVPPAPKDG